MTGWQTAFLAWYLGGKLDRLNRQSKTEEAAREKAETEAREQEEFEKWKADMSEGADPNPVVRTRKEKMKAVLAGVFIFGNFAVAFACLVTFHFLFALFFAFVGFLPILTARK